MTRDEGALWFDGLLAAEIMHKEYGYDPSFVATIFASAEEQGDEHKLIAKGAEDYWRHASRLKSMGLA